MRYISSLVSLLALAVSISCSQSEQGIPERKAVTRSLTGCRMKIGELLDNPGIRAVCQDYIFLYFSQRDTSQLVAYRIEGDSLKYFNGFVDKGRGPQEVIYTDFSFNGDTLFYSNGSPSGISQFFGIPLTDMSQLKSRRRWKEYASPRPEMMTWQNYTAYGPGRFLIAGGIEEERHFLTLVDCIAGKSIPVRYWPNDSTDVPVHSKQMVYADCQLCSQGDLVCYAHRHSRYLSIFKVKDGGSYLEKAVIYPKLPEYELMKDGWNIRYLDKNNDGIRIFSTKDYIFAQLRRTPQEIEESELYKGFPSSYFDELEVYDWNGKFVANFQVDTPFVSFAVSSDNHHLYTKTMNPETTDPVLMRYELPL